MHLLDVHIKEILFPTRYLSHASPKILPDKYQNTTLRSQLYSRKKNTGFDCFYKFMKITATGSQKLVSVAIDV